MNYTIFLKIFVFYKKVKDKNKHCFFISDARSDAHLEAFLIKQGMLFLARL